MVIISSSFDTILLLIFKPTTFSNHSYMPSIIQCIHYHLVNKVCTSLDNNAGSLLYHMSDLQCVGTSLDDCARYKSSHGTHNGE